MKKVKLKITKDTKNKVTTISNIKFFNLIKTLESGQTFRYVINEVNNSVIVISSGISTKMYQKENDSLILETIDDDIINMWIKFFNLELDMEDINNEIIKIDPRLKRAIELSDGVRIIHNNVEETIITFIISANNNMKRIKMSVDMMSEKYGKMIAEYDSKKIYAFPNIEIISKLELQEIRDLKVGFRDRYIKETAEFLSSNKNYINMLEDSSGEHAKEELMKLKGIGEKVADCIRLFSLNKFESFPVDTWIEKYMLKYYKEDIIKFIEENKVSKEKKEIKITRKDITMYAQNKYKELSGFAQQYMFYYSIVEKEEL